MGRTFRNSLKFPAAMEVRAGAPLDDRQTVDVEADLTTLSVWKATDGGYYHYKGMPVTVGATGEIFVYIGADGSTTDVVDATKWVKVGGSAGVSSWNDLTDKPESFPPSEHNHQASEVKFTPTGGNETTVDATLRQISLDLAGKGTYSKPANGIPASDLASGVIPTVPTKVSELTNDSGFGTYSKPTGGIPSTDLAQSVQTSLGKADSAVQVPTSPETDAQYVMKNGAWSKVVVPDGKDARVGELTGLQTSSKVSIVSAINEVLEVAHGTADHENVIIVVTSSVTGVSAANRTINVYINGDTTNPQQVTTDANGRASVNIAVPNTYKLVFPNLEGCADIVDVTHTAAISQRLIEVEYEAVQEFSERVRVSAMKYYGLYAVTPMVDTKITITYDGESRVFNTDSNGYVEVDIPLNKSVTVVAETLSGYFFYGHSQEQFTTNSSERYFQFRYVEIDSGISVICSDGKQYTYEELVEQQIEPSSCMVIKVATQTLVDKECVFALSIDIIRARSWTTKQWSNNTSILLSSFTGDKNYDGYGMSVAYSAEGVTRSITTPAIDYALTFSQVVNSYNLKGFLPANQQMNIAWSNRLTIDKILDYCRPIDSDGKFVNQLTNTSVNGYTWSSYTTNKWCSTQNNALYAYCFSSALNYNYYKTTTSAVVPFFAF